MTLTIWCEACRLPMKPGPTGYPTCTKCRRVVAPSVPDVRLPCGRDGCCRDSMLPEHEREKREGCNKCKPFSCGAYI